MISVQHERRTFTVTSGEPSAMMRATVADERPRSCQIRVLRESAWERGFERSGTSTPLEELLGALVGARLDLETRAQDWEEWFYVARESEPLEYRPGPPKSERTICVKLEFAGEASVLPYNEEE